MKSASLLLGFGLSLWIDIALASPALPIDSSAGLGLRARDGGSSTNRLPITEYCSPAQSRIVDKALRSGQADLAAAVQDAAKGHSSDYGFTAMFKGVLSAGFVQSLLNTLIARPPRQFIMTDHSIRSSLPRFVCVSRATIRLYPDIFHGQPDPLSECYRSGSGINSFYMGGTPYIFLCPALFKISAVPPAGTTAACPPVTMNSFGVLSPVFSLYLSYMLIHELVHFYLPSHGLGPYTYPAEQYDLNPCVGLDPISSLLNPNNYIVYIACESSSRRSLLPAPR